MISGRNYKILIIFTVAFLTSAIVVSQAFQPQHQDEDLRKSVKDVVEYWKAELDLSPEQAALMERKIFEFARKKNRLIQSKMRQEAKTKRLKHLQEQEFEEMREILSIPQYELYLTRSKERIQRQYQQ